MTSSSSTEPIATLPLPSTSSTSSATTENPINGLTPQIIPSMPDTPLPARNTTTNNVPTQSTSNTFLPFQTTPTPISSSPKKGMSSLTRPTQSSAAKATPPHAHGHASSPRSPSISSPRHPSEASREKAPTSARSQLGINIPHTPITSNLTQRRVTVAPAGGSSHGQSQTTQSSANTSTARKPSLQTQNKFNPQLPPRQGSQSSSTISGLPQNISTFSTRSISQAISGLPSASRYTSSSTVASPSRAGGMASPKASSSSVLSSMSRLALEQQPVKTFGMTTRSSSSTTAQGRAPVPSLAPIGRVVRPSPSLPLPASQKSSQVTRPSLRVASALQADISSLAEAGTLEYQPIPVPLPETLPPLPLDIPGPPVTFPPSHGLVTSVMTLNEFLASDKLAKFIIQSRSPNLETSLAVALSDVMREIVKFGTSNQQKSITLGWEGDILRSQPLRRKVQALHDETLRCDRLIPTAKSPSSDQRAVRFVDIYSFCDDLMGKLRQYDHICETKKANQKMVEEKDEEQRTTTLTHQLKKELTIARQLEALIRVKFQFAFHQTGVYLLEAHHLCGSRSAYIAVNDLSTRMIIVVQGMFGIDVPVEIRKKFPKRQYTARELREGGFFDCEAWAGKLPKLKWYNHRGKAKYLVDQEDSNLDTAKQLHEWYLYTTKDLVRRVLKEDGIEFDLGPEFNQVIAALNEFKLRLQSGEEIMDLYRGTETFLAALARANKADRETLLKSTVPTTKASSSGPKQDKSKDGDHGGSGGGGGDKGGGRLGGGNQDRSEHGGDDSGGGRPSSSGNHGAGSGESRGGHGDPSNQGQVNRRAAAAGDVEDKFASTSEIPPATDSAVDTAGTGNKSEPGEPTATETATVGNLPSPATLDEISLGEDAELFTENKESRAFEEALDESGALFTLYTSDEMDKIVRMLPILYLLEEMLLSSWLVHIVSRTNAELTLH